MAVLATLPKSLQGPGEVISPSVTVPTGLSKVRVTANLDLADKQNPAVTFHCELEWSDDNVTFHTFAGFGFVGGPYTDKQGNVNPDPWVEVDAGALAGLKVRAHIESLSKRINIGATISDT